MNLYFDSSALAKRYLDEEGSEDVFRWTADAVVCATVLITRAEMVAAIMHASRRGVIEIQTAEPIISDFRNDWMLLHRLPITEGLVARADRLACEFGLRGYAAVHLAAALIWQDQLGLPVTLATFDRELAEAGRQSGLAVLPG
jgi:predicted nucleic acid-binding protein